MINLLSLTVEGREVDEPEEHRGRMEQDFEVKVVPAGGGTAVAAVKAPALRPLLAGTATPEVMARVEAFYKSIERIFESWVQRSESQHTRRARIATTS